MIRVLNVPGKHPLNRLSERLKERIVASQTDGIDSEFKNGYELCLRALSDLKVSISPPRSTAGISATDLGDKPLKDLIKLYSEMLSSSGVPEQAIHLQAANLSTEPSCCGHFTILTK